MDHYTIFSEMQHYTDRAAYISDLALSSAWGDDPTDDIPPERIESLAAVWDACHDINALLDTAGMTQADFSRRFNIPYRTVQGWSLGERTPPAYVLRMAAEILL